MTTPIPKLSQLTQSVWRLLGCNPSAMTLKGTNMYLVGQGPKRILVDAGPTGFPEYIDNMKKLLTQQKVIVDQLILTHWHLDHTAGLKDLVPVFKETNKGVFPCVYKFPRTDKPDNPIPLEYPFEELKDGQTLTTDGVSLKIYHAPGHTSDHALLHYLEENSLFCGDCLLGEGTGLFDDLCAYMNTLNLMDKLDSKAIYCGHGPVISNPAASLKYNIEHQNIRERRIFRFLDDAAPQALSINDIVGSMYKGLSSGLRKQATASTQLHLTKLQRENRIQYVQGRYCVRTSNG